MIARRGWARIRSPDERSDIRGNSPLARRLLPRRANQLAPVTILTARKLATMRTETPCAERGNSQIDSVASRQSVDSRENFTSVLQNYVIVCAHPASTGGAFRDRHERGRRDAVDARAAQTSGAGADGQVVWSRSPDAGIKPCGTFRRVTVAKKPDTGESTKQPLKPLRRECRV